jgi:hypothetical protein
MFFKISVDEQSPKNPVIQIDIHHIQDTLESVISLYAI